DLVEYERRLDDIRQIQVQLLDQTLTPVEKLSLIASVADRPLTLGVVTQLASGENKASAPLQPATPEMVKPSVAWKELNTKLHTLQAQMDELSEKYLPGNS